MLRSRAGLVVVGLALLGSASAGATDRILLLIEQTLYNQVQTRLLRYQTEVEDRFPVQLVIQTGSFESQTPAQIRARIQSEWTTNGLAGVLLCGQIPYITWQQDPAFGSNYGPLAFYYEDLDGTFTDQNSDGFYDYHDWGTHDGPEIWSCWLRPPAVNKAGYLNALLDEAHDYYTGAFVVNKLGYVACHADYDNNFWPATSTIPSMPALVDIYGSGYVGTDGEGADPVVASELKAVIFAQSFEIVHFWSHASNTLAAWDSGHLTSADVMSAGARRGPLIAHIYGCHSGDFRGYEGTSTGNTNLAVAYAFGPGAGQASSGTSWSYGTEGMNLITERMRDGAYLGRAWKYLLDTRENSVAVHNRYPDRDIHKELSGNNLFGNPFLYANWTGSTVVNVAPVVAAGPDQTIYLPAGAMLSGTVTDDGLPDPPGYVTVQWTQVSGPTACVFSAPAAATTGVSFSTPGTYVLRLTADDGVRSTSDTTTITVHHEIDPPLLEEVAATDGTHVLAIFSETLDPNTAQVPGNYSLDCGAAVQGVTLDTTGRMVTLTTSSLQAGVTHTLSVQHVTDLVGNPVPAGTSASFVPGLAVRVTDGLSALYDFHEGGGTTVHDVAHVGAPLDLTIESPAGVQWTDGGLRIVGGPYTRLSAPSAATKVIAACQASDELTLEAWVQPALAAQSGPARIVTLSSGLSYRDFTLGHGAPGGTSGAQFDLRVRIGADSNGLPSIATPPGTATTDLTHVVFTRAADGVERLYVGGALVGTGVRSGSFATWNSACVLALGNEVGAYQTKMWLGEYRLVAIYSRALSVAEVLQNYFAGADPQVSPAVCRGDANCDASVNWRDIDYLVAGMNSNESAWRALFPTPGPACLFSNVDVDGDGVVNWRDIDPFIGAMNTTCP